MAVPCVEKVVNSEQLDLESTIRGSSAAVLGVLVAASSMSAQI
jgi:hypothetical protein